MPMREAKQVIGLASLLVLCGCGTKSTWLPMKVGKSWTYRVRAGLNHRIETVKIVRELTVAAAPGYELAGPSGSSRLAWKGRTLVAECTANGTYAPPLPLLVADADLSHDVPLQVATWHGLMTVRGQPRDASGYLSEKMDVVDFGTRRVSALLATLTMDVDGAKGPVELKSWYQEGVGLIQQEQRTNKVRVVQLQLISRPAE